MLFSEHFWQTVFAAKQENVCNDATVYYNNAKYSIHALQLQHWQSIHNAICPAAIKITTQPVCPEDQMTSSIIKYKVYYITNADDEYFKQ